MKRIVVVLAVVMVAVMLFASCGVSQEEVDELVSTAYNTGYSEGEEAGYDEGYQAGYDAYADPDNPGPVIVELNARIYALNAGVEYLTEPTPEVSAEIVGTATLEELISFEKSFFADAAGTVGSYTQGPFPLVSLETLKDFLAQDKTETRPRFFSCDDLHAFRLKDNWIRAGLPGHSLSLIAVGSVEDYYWSCIFITKEQGQLIVYQVNPSTDTVTKMTEAAAASVLYVFIQDRI